MITYASNLICLLFLAVFLIGLTGISIIKAQDKDAGLWTTIGIEVKVVKKVTASFSQEFRFNENISELGTIFSEAGLEYKVNKHFRVSANYRFTLKKRLDDYYGSRYRFFVDVKYDKKIKPIEITWRGRLQKETANPTRSEFGGIPEYYLRNKIGAKWDLDKPYAPYLSLEVFSRLSYPRFYAFDNIRTSVGMEYAFSKHHKVDLYYMIQKEFYVSHPETDFIIGLGYLYKI